MVPSSLTYKHKSMWYLFLASAPVWVSISSHTGVFLLKQTPAKVELLCVFLIQVIINLIILE